jgi:hypothetical protein
VSTKDIRVGRHIKTDGMSYAPTNEQGVVFLFGRLAPRLGFEVEVVQTAFPDCIARRNGKTCRIEFEYRASSYKNHPPRGADLIVCWDNDWAHRPRKFRHLEILDLKRYVGALPRVFAVGCDESVRGYKVDGWATLDWSVPKNAQAGDLVVMYRKKPASEIRDLWTVRGPFYEHKKWGLQTTLKCLIRLDKPLKFEDLKKDPTTRGLAVMRKQFQGKSDITADWPHILALILKRNPKAKKQLRDYSID